MTHSRSVANLTVIVTLAVVYFVAAKSGLMLARVHPSATAVWPPTGIALAALLLLGYRVWPAIFLGAFLANVTTAGSAATSLGIATGNTLEGLLGAYLTNRFCDGLNAFDRTQDVFRFTIFAVLLSTTVSATLGVTSLALGGYASSSDYGAVWFTWWLGDAGGSFIVAPLLMLWGLNPRIRWNRNQLFEAGLLLFSLVVITQIVFGGWSLTQNPFPYTYIPVLVWAAFRFGQRETATVTALTAGIAIWGTLRGVGPFVRESQNESLLLLVFFLCVASVMAMAVAAGVSERKRADEALRRANDELDLRVQQRTRDLSEATEALRVEIVGRKRAEEQIQRNLERIRAQYEINQAITSTLDLGTVLNVLMEKIDLIFPNSATTVRLYNRESRELEYTACRNIPLTEWQAYAKKGTRGLADIVLDSKIPLVVSNIQRDPRSRDPEFFRKHALVSYIGIPLIAKGEVLGVLGFHTKEEHQFTYEEREFLTALAGQAALAIYNSRLYEEMVRANKVKDEFLSVMSHELRTPLNVVMGYTGMIKDGLLGDINPEQEEALGKILGRARDQLDLINSILHATSFEADVAKVESHEVNLGNFINELTSAYEVPLEKGFMLNWDYPSNLPAVKTDSAKLKQILQNLINNAIKFTDKGQVTISVRLTKGNGQVEFRVADTGIGIPKEHLSLIFEKFRQVDSSETRLYGGVGMGLYIVKKFTEILGGTVEVESEPGKGSTFTVTIPS